MREREMMEKSLMLSSIVGTNKFLWDELFTEFALHSLMFQDHAERVIVAYG